MGVRIIHDDRDDLAVLYCSTSDWAFGPVFYSREREDADGNYLDTRYAAERAEAFCDWFTDGDAAETAARLGIRATGSGNMDDPRCFSDVDLERLYEEWLTIEDATAREAT